MSTYQQQQHRSSECERRGYNLRPLASVEYLESKKKHSTKRGRSTQGRIYAEHGRVLVGTSSVLRRIKWLRWSALYMQSSTHLSDATSTGRLGTELLVSQQLSFLPAVFPTARILQVSIPPGSLRYSALMRPWRCYSTLESLPDPFIVSFCFYCALRQWRRGVCRSNHIATSARLSVLWVQPLPRRRLGRRKHQRIETFSACLYHYDTCTFLPPKPSPYCCSPSLMGEVFKNAATVDKH